MDPSDLRGSSTYYNDPLPDIMLEHFQYILYFAQKYVSSNIGPVDSDDVAQEACIKFWLICKKQHIDSPRAYIRKIVHTIVADMVRKYKSQLFQTLSIDEHGEISEIYLMNVEEAELSNPETILEQKESLDETMKKLMDAVTDLPPRQKISTVTTLRRRVDDLIQFVTVLQENNLDSELEWPIERVERQRLQASFPHGRRSIAHTMNIDLDEYL
jgi:RNA polymerase sigma factor (sigma-70 family)